MLAAFDNWIFVLLVAMAALLRLLASKAGGQKKDSEDESVSTRRPSQSPAPRSPSSDEDQIRKFLEALGQPTTSKPPPPVTPKKELPPRPVAPVRPPPVMFPVPTPVSRRRRVVEPQKPVAEDWLRKINLPGQVIEPVKEIATFVPRHAEETFEIRKSTAAEPEPPPLPRTHAEAYAIATAPAQRTELGKIDLAVLLASPSGLRTAIILREIFGPPRSLQPLGDPVGIA